MNQQDWEPMVIHSSKQVTQKPKITPNYTEDSVKRHKIDKATEPQKRKMLSTEARQMIASMRAAMKITQVELNQRCSFAPNTIRDFESGRMIPAQSQLNILNRVLKTALKLT
jgi:ribosome-binding protein aMBF1 (putative translation factor)